MVGNENASPSAGRHEAAGPTSRLTVRGLANEPGLGLTVLHAGDMERAVHRARVIEIANPAQWLEPGSVVLTRGLRFAGASEAGQDQAALVDELADFGIPALVFGVGAHFRSVPTSLVRAARRRDLCLMSVGPETRLDGVEDFVSRATTSAGTRRMARALRLHHGLLGALSAAEPIPAVIARLAVLCRGCAVLYDAFGEPVASAGGGPVRLMWADIAAASRGSSASSVGRWRTAFRQLDFRGSRRYLAVASRDSRFVADAGQDILDAAEQVLAAAHAMRAVWVEEEEEEARRLLSSLCSGRSGWGVRQTSERLRAFGFKPGTPMRLLAAAPATRPGSAGTTSSSGALMQRARRDGVGLVLAADEGEGEDDAGAPSVTALVSVGGRTDDWVRFLSRTHVAGLSAVFRDLAAVPSASSEAMSAYRMVKRQVQRGGSSRILRVDDMDLLTWLLAGREHRELSTRVDRHLAQLSQHAGLVDTLATYLACDLDVAATASRLFVHPNTIRYRLSRTEELLGGSLRDTATIVNAYLALQEAVHERRAPG